MLQQQTKAATQPRTGSTFCHNLTKAKHGDSSHPFSFWPNGRRLRPPPPPCMVFRVLLRPAALPVFRAACRAVGSSDPETSRNEPSGRPSLVAGGGAGSCVCGGGHVEWFFSARCGTGRRCGTGEKFRGYWLQRGVLVSATVRLRGGTDPGSLVGPGWG